LKIGYANLTTPHFRVVSTILLLLLFSGDIGGYLGLLIGGSVLTIVEVIDLVCYNAVLRCCAAR